MKTHHVAALFIGLAAAVLVMVLLPRRVQHTPPPPAAVTTTPAPEAVPDSSLVPVTTRSRQVGFHSRERLKDHYSRHGREFGPVSMEDYLYLAQQLRDRPPGGSVLEAERADGVITRFDRSSGAFLAFDRDGTIRTFFKPNDGEAYFRRQLQRTHE